MDCITTTVQYYAEPYYTCNLAISAVSTFVSVILIVSLFPKCTKNYIHMNLLLALLLRSVVFVWWNNSNLFTEDSHDSEEFQPEL